MDAHRAGSPARYRQLEEFMPFWLEEDIPFWLVQDSVFFCVDCWLDFWFAALGFLDIKVTSFRLVHP